jgi:exodeoxyribonuclease VII small subunit
MEQTFEESLNELERIVKQLENGDLPLEESLKLFEQGIKLSRLCKERLTAAERRIEVLIKDGRGDLNIATLETDEE